MQRTCRNCRRNFLVTPTEEAGYRKFGFDPISECFDCMEMHKLSFRNGRTLYRRTCDATKANIISMYAPDSPYKVFERSYWYSDAWDPLAYGRDVDFSRPFFAQFKELQRKVPRISLFNVNTENSEYCNMCTGNKDSFCVFGGDYNDSVLYGVLCMHNRSCVDCDYSNKNELCHDAFNSFECYGCQSIVDSKHCTGCAYVSDCIGCQECILCVNLKNRQYCIGNEQMSKEEYDKKKTALLNGSATTHAENLRRFRHMRTQRIAKFAHMISSENCTGDFIENSKDCANVYFCTDSQDVNDAIFATDAKDCFRSSLFGHGSELLFQSMSIIGSNSCLGCFSVFDCQVAEYCDTALNSSNVFGCVGVRHKKNCILNKQYTSKEYEKLRGKLIEHMRNTKEWGEFFPKELSCFDYNESTAMEFFPLSKEEALKREFRWRDGEEEKPGTEKVISADRLPDDIAAIPDDVLNWAIQCEKTGRLFKIIKQELEFLRTQRIPLPHLHPDVRFLERFAQYSNPPRLHRRACEKCEKVIETTYPPDRPEIVYCEECYLKEVY